MPTTQSEDPNEQVHHPRHYNQHPSDVECIEIIEHLPANLSHAFKYIWRCGLKTANDPTRELGSAAWYVRREINRRERFDLQGFDDWGVDPIIDKTWRGFAERVIAYARAHETRDFLAFCLGALLRDDLEELVSHIEREQAQYDV